MNAEKLMVQCFSFIEVMTNLAKSGGPPWDAIPGAEVVKHYKPDKEVYRSAPYFFGLKPEEVMMCAAHATDLNAARPLNPRFGVLPPSPPANWSSAS